MDSRIKLIMAHLTASAKTSLNIHGPRILIYHNIVNQDAVSGMNLPGTSSEAFELHIRYLLDNSFKIIHIDEMVDYLLLNSNNTERNIRSLETVRL